MTPPIVIIVAAGSGTRFGSELPKQFLPLCGQPVLAHAIDAFRKALPEARIITVLSSSMTHLWNNLCLSHGIEPTEIVAGGESRWESVKNAIEAIADAPPSSIVLIHDGARPLVDNGIITRAVAAARNTDGAIPAIPVTDSLRRLNSDEVHSEPVDRAPFRAVQTPQAFSLWRLREAYKLPYQPGFTDDDSVLAEAGFSNIVLVEGSPRNIKITTPVDMLLAEAIIKAYGSANPTTLQR